MRQRVLIAVMLLAALGIGIVAAQSPDCESNSCDYLPAVSVNGPTATPTRTPLPPLPEHTICTTRGPAPAEGAQIWLTQYNLARGASAWVCVRVTRDGRPLPYALVRVLARYPDRVARIDQGLTKSDGVLALPLTVGAVAPHQLVAIEAEVEIETGMIGTMTQFLSQPTATPTRTPPTPTRTAIPTLTSVPPTDTPQPTSTPTPTST